MLLSLAIVEPARVDSKFVARVFDKLNTSGNNIEGFGKDLIKQARLSQEHAGLKKKKQVKITSYKKRFK